MWTQFNSKNLAFSLFYFSCSFRSCSFFLVCECGVFYVHSKLVGWLVWLVCLFVVLILHSVYFSFVFLSILLYFQFLLFCFCNPMCVWCACVHAWFVCSLNVSEYHVTTADGQWDWFSLEWKALRMPQHIYGTTAIVVVFVYGACHNSLSWNMSWTSTAACSCCLRHEWRECVCAVQCSTHSYECEHVTRLCAKNRRSYELWILL